MIVNSLITSVSKYFSSLSVDSLYGNKKVSLIVADENKKQTTKIITLDATTSFELSMNSTPIQVPSETKRVYMDGARKMPDVININAVVDKTKMVDIQKIADANTWLYIVVSKPFSGTIGDVGYYANSKLYYITNLSVIENMSINTIDIRLTLNEVVLYNKDIKIYKFEIKQNNPIAGTTTEQNTKTQDPPPGLFGETSKDSGLMVIVKTLSSSMGVRGDLY